MLKLRGERPAIGQSAENSRGGLHVRRSSVGERAQPPQSKIAFNDTTTTATLFAGGGADRLACSDSHRRNAFGSSVPIRHCPGGEPYQLRADRALGGAASKRLRQYASGFLGPCQLLSKQVFAAHCAGRCLMRAFELANI
jgi:hypothetical protein